MTSDSNKEKARKQVLRWLRHGELTLARTRERLLEKGFDEQVAHAVVDELAAAGILDDARCARVKAQFASWLVRAMRARPRH